MKKLMLGLAILSAAALVYLGYERLFVQKSFGAAAVIGFVVIGAFLALTAASWLLYDTRFRGAIGSAWLAGVTTVVFYLVADGIVGFVLIKPLSPALVPDEFRHHKLVPDSYSRLEQPDFSYIQRVNKLGLRGRETTVEKPDGVYRILTLGDSFTMGKGVEDDQTFSVLLETLLNKAPGSSCKSKKIEVLNGGVDSYAPVLSNIELRRDLASLKPDLIIHNLDNSDLVQEAAYRKAAVLAADGSVLAVPNVARQASLTDRTRDWIDQHLFFTRAMLYYASKNMGTEEINVRTVATQANREIVLHTLAADHEPRDAQWRDIFASIDSIRTFAAEHNAEYVLSIYPWAHQISKTEWIPGRYTYMSADDVPSDNSLLTIRKMSAERGIHLAEMYPVFQAYSGTDKLYFSNDPHWTAAGQRLMAEGLADYLRKNYTDAWCQ
jgi:hypothetical protein